MYPRQFKQFLKNAVPDFDERRYGSIADLMRACQKDGILRLERDRQGGLRVFQGGGSARTSVPHGWGVAHRENGGNGDQPAEAAPEIANALPVIEPPVVDAQVIEVSEASAPSGAPRTRRARKTATGEKKKAAPRKKKASA